MASGSRRRQADSRRDSLIAAAPADIADHAVNNFLVRRVRIVGDQGRGLHDLAALAKSALRHVQFAPRRLHRLTITHKSTVV